MKRFDVMSPRPKKDGTTFWHRVGTAFEGDKGIGVEFDSIPLPDKEGRVSVRLFEPRERSAAIAPPRPGYPQNTPADDLADDVPW